MEARKLRVCVVGAGVIVEQQFVADTQLA